MLKPGMHSIDEPGREEIDPVFQILMIAVPNGFYIAVCGGGNGLLHLLIEIDIASRREQEPAQLFI